MIWRFFYSLLWYLATPLIKHYLRKRARQAPDYLDHWDERFGRAQATQKQKQAIWVHAVSVGETRAALPLVRALRERWPDAPLLITQMTPTGRATARTLYGDGVEIRYLPYDYPAAVRRFFAAYKPLFGILMETELWPNLIHAAKESQTPLFLANARLSEKSFNGYRRLPGLMAPAMRALGAVAAQSEGDAARLRALGGEQVVVCGNTKYDFDPPAAQLELGKRWRGAIGSRRVVVCASTRDGEEALILQAWREKTPDALLVLVPRHPERFAAVERLVRECGFHVECRSTAAPPSAAAQVWIGDSMGEMFAYYALADLVFMGGSLLPLGGQNLIEPASIGVPVLMGPSTFNFAEASAHAFAGGAALQVGDAAETVAVIKRLLHDDARRGAMAQAGLTFSRAHRGASARIVDLIATQLQQRM
jgi:3-deoxy-D-manno-octulosonic-acid transferase